MVLVGTQSLAYINAPGEADSDMGELRFLLGCARSTPAKHRFADSCDVLELDMKLEEL